MFPHFRDLESEHLTSCENVLDSTKAFERHQYSPHKHRSHQLRVH